MDAQPFHARSEPPLQLVELVALPGAGKTTIIDAAVALAPIKTRRDLSAEWEALRAGTRAGHIGRSVASSRRVRAASRFALGARLARPESMLRLVRLVAKAEWLASRSGPVFLDQGFLQDLTSILLSAGARSCEPALLAPLIGALYDGIDTTIALVAVEPAIAAARLAQRKHGKSRFEDLAGAELRSALEPASSVQDMVLEAARLAGLTFRTLDGSQPPDLAAEQLLALVPGLERREGGAASPVRPRRISIVGSTGSGKSYLARKVADALDLPVFELDELKKTTAAAGDAGFRTKVAEIVDGDRWIIDGHYRDVRQMIWRRSDLVVWLNYPLSLVARRLIGRFAQKRVGKPVKSAAAASGGGAEQGASWGRRFGRLSRTLRERQEYGRVLRSPDYPDLTLVELRSARSTDQWLRDMTRTAEGPPSA